MSQIEKSRVLSIFEIVFDYYSARTVLAEAATKANLEGERWTKEEIERLCDQALQIDQKCQKIVPKLLALFGSPEPTKDLLGAREPEAEVSPAPAEAPQQQEVPAPGAPEVATEAPATEEAPVAAEIEAGAIVEVSEEAPTEVAPVLPEEEANPAPVSAPAPKKEKPALNLPFEVLLKGAPEAVVKMVGEGTLLGDWKVEEAPAGQAVEGGVRFEMAFPKGSKLTFKFVALPKNGEEPRWEGGENRTMVVDGPVELSWYA